MEFDPLDPFDPRAEFARSPVARLATVTAGGVPHLVPVVFAVRESDGRSIIYTAVDGKPKTTRRLRRIANIENTPAVSLLVDRYSDDWTELWWVRVDGTATVVHEGELLHTGYRLLRAKYVQYESLSLDGPVIAIPADRWSSWHA